jgi:glycosyltransferase involved in cell wall biosynthesis
MPDRFSMRLCFYNPHAGLFGISLFHWLFKKPFQAKYAWMLRYVRSPSHSTAFVVDGTVSSFPVHYVTHARWVVWVVAFFEIYLWCLLNGLNPFRQTIIFSTSRLNPSADILFGLGFLSNPFELYDPGQTILGTYRGKRLLHLSHYFNKTAFLAGRLTAAGIRAYVAEADVSATPYFRAFFPADATVYTLPFVLRPRYRATTPFARRSRRCLAVGTTHQLPVNDFTRDYCTFFKTNNYHRMRRLLYDNRDSDASLMDLRVSLLEESPLPSGRFYRSWLLYQYFYKLFRRGQPSYFSFDIVALYNEHMMFVSPEEDVGLPSINFIEGMACGCAYIGIAHDMYSSLGMRAGEHYIAYDGTLTGLKEAITYYSDRPNRLEKIAHSGHRFATECFAEPRVADTFWEDIQQYSTTEAPGCSFIAEC